MYNIVKCTNNSRALINLFLSAVTVLSVQSCGTFLELVHGPAYASTTKHTLAKTIEMIDSSGCKSVVLVPMVHIGTKEDYEKITYFVDGLKSNGYVTFDEGMYMPENIDSSYRDTLIRKVRRVFGHNVPMYYASLSSHHKSWSFQTTEMLKNDMHLSSERDINTDMSLVEFIDIFEQRYGPVTLDEYDMMCPLNDKNYKREKLPGSRWLLHMVITNNRNDRLLDHITNDGYDKIVVLYGSVHTSAIKFTLHSRYGYRYKYPK